MKSAITKAKLKTVIIFISSIVSLSCILPTPDQKDTDTDGNNFSSNYMFTYLILLNQMHTANYCPKPSQILRKNTDYPVTLTEGQPYYFHYHYLDNAKPQEESRNYLFKITKQTGTSVTYKENTYCNSATSRFTTVAPTSAIATEQSYDLIYSSTFRQSWQIPNIYSVEVTSGDPTITLRQD